MIISTQRSGVFSQFSTINSFSNFLSTGTVAVIASASNNSSSNIQTFYNSSDVFAFYGNDTLSSNIAQGCSVLFQNGVHCIKTKAADSSDDYIDALEEFKSIPDINVIVIDKISDDILEKLAETVDYASNNQAERIAVVGLFDNSQSPSTSTATQTALSINHPRICAVYSKGSTGYLDKSSSFNCACALAAIIASANDPCANFSSFKINGLTEITAQSTSQTVDLLIQNGIVVLETVNNSKHFVRVVSTKTKDINQNADYSFKDINTILIIDYVLSSLRNMLKSKLSTFKNNALSLDAIKTQLTVALNHFISTNIINSFSPPNVFKSPSANDICIAEIGFEVACALNQIHISATITI